MCTNHTIALLFYSPGMLGSAARLSGTVLTLTSLTALSIYQDPLLSLSRSSTVYQDPLLSIRILYCTVYTVTLSDPLLETS